MVIKLAPLNDDGDDADMGMVYFKKLAESKPVCETSRQHPPCLLLYFLGCE